MKCRERQRRSNFQNRYLQALFRFVVADREFCLKKLKRIKTEERNFKNLFSRRYSCKISASGGYKITRLQEDLHYCYVMKQINHRYTKWIPMIIQNNSAIYNSLLKVIIKRGLIIKFNEK